MRKSGIKVMSALLGLVLMIVCFSGCINFSEFTAPPEGQSKHPTRQVITVDTNGSAHIIWKTYDTTTAEYYIQYTMVDTKGNKVENKNIAQKNLHRSRLVRDAEDYLYFFFETPSIECLKITTDGKILFDKKIPNSGYHNDTLDRSEIFEIITDNKSNFHIIWVNTNLSASYVMMNSEGDIVASKWLNEFFENITISFHAIDFSFDMDMDSKGVLHVIWKDGHNTFNTNNYTVGGITSTLFGDAIRIDSEDNIHILSSGGRYKKISSNGTVLISDDISNVSVIADYPVVKDDDENYLYLGDNGCVDSNNCVHIVSKSVETKVWRSGRHYKEYQFYTIYYSKIDSNGTILVDQMVIDSDGEPSWENASSPISTLLCGWVVFLIAAAVIIAAFLFLRRKHAKHS